MEQHVEDRVGLDVVLVDEDVAHRTVLVVSLLSHDLGREDVDLQLFDGELVVLCDALGVRGHVGHGGDLAQVEHRRARVVVLLLLDRGLHEEVAAEHHLHLLGVANVALGRQHLENFEPHVVGLELDEDRGDGVHDGAHGEAALALPLGVVEVRVLLLLLLDVAGELLEVDDVLLHI